MSTQTQNNLKEQLIGVARRRYDNMLRKFEDFVDIIHSASGPKESIALVVELLVALLLPQSDEAENTEYPSFSHSAFLAGLEAMTQLFSAKSSPCEDFHKGLSAQAVAERLFAKMASLRERLGKPAEVAFLACIAAMENHIPYVDVQHKVAPLDLDKAREFITPNISLFSQLTVLLRGEDGFAAAAAWLVSVPCSEEVRAALIYQAMSKVAKTNRAALEVEVPAGLSEALDGLLASLRARRESAGNA